jgi:hypothetical protein
LAHQARRNVVDAAWGKADDEAYRPRRIGLRLCDARHGGEGGSTRCQTQKTSTRKFQGLLRPGTIDREYDEAWIDLRSND